MGPDFMIAMLKYAIGNGALTMAPVLAAGLVIGISVGAVQAATQVNEPTLTFVPKVIGVGLVGSLVLPWALDRFVGIMFMMVAQFGEVVR